MTQEEILNGNLLIARFMSGEPEVLEKDLLKAGTLESMSYHSDWNLLIDVVKKLNPKIACASIDLDIKEQFTEVVYRVQLNSRDLKHNNENSTD